MRNGALFQGWNKMALPDSLWQLVERNRFATWPYGDYSISALINSRIFRRAIARIAVFGAIAVGLGGCGISTTGEQSIFVLGCVPERAELLEGVVWDDIKPIRISAMESDFRPMVFHFIRGKAYVLDITNLDRSANNIWAPGFLKQGVALHSIQIGQSQPATGCVNGIRIKPKSNIRIQFVAANEGRYEVHNTMFPIIPNQVSGGVYYVDPPRPGIPES